jgi:tetratricopeptide (TPR) repeat protein
MMAEPLQALGNYELGMKDTGRALDLFSRAADLTRNTYGEDSEKYADSVKYIGMVYFFQKDYAKAEPYFLRGVRVQEASGGKDANSLLASLTLLSKLYEAWDQPDKLEACERQLVSLMEKQFGPDSPVLIIALGSEAKALRELGRTEDAGKVEQRLQAIQVNSGINLAQGGGMSPQP